MVHDHLTGLYNRYYLQEFFTQKKNDNLRYSLLYIDLDDFKEVNDRQYGYDIGDILLKKVDELFKQYLPENSVTARIGGDEFVLLIPVTTLEMKESMEL